VYDHLGLGDLYDQGENQQPRWQFSMGFDLNLGVLIVRKALSECYFERVYIL
jgi:hypothetical protein